MDKKNYKRMVEKRADRSPILQNTVAAYLVGGGICLFGEALRRAYLSFGAVPADAPLLVSVTLIALSVVATATGLFAKIAHVGGAGTLVPVTGFANSIASSAIDAITEGPVLGVGAGIFTVAGPVLLYGTLAGVAYGILLLLGGGVG